ncbi:hypothetical protein FH972_011276 [Carpinus fangiana]|uniref:Germin-like protein n=1 Tax=Carpinus fangiana TaxID=176857 RepID=A0A660KQT3_9ROSI|nr:hypothetical protein FH972_011276 [Carpinus fangiana]
MSQKLKLLLIVTLFHSHVAFASDPDPVQDFCIAIKDSASGNPSCKNPSTVTVEDFTFSGIKFPGNYSQTGISIMLVNSNVFPGLNTLGMSFVRADLGVGGVNVPHYHPRATETLFATEGRIYAGFVDSNNKVYAKVMEKGEVIVFPRGLAHFQMNVGNTPASFVGSFNSQNPGLQRIPAAIFGSGIEEALLEKAFGLDANEIAELRKRFQVPH